MSSVTDVTDQSVKVSPAPAPVATPVAVAPAGDPSVLGLPAFIVGSIALGFSLTGYVPDTAQASIIPIVLAATGLGLLVATLWAARLGQTVVAGIFGVFTGFWWSYAALVLGLNHNWYAIPTEDVNKSVGIFLLCWTLLIGLLTLATLRLPVAFTALLGLVTVALALVTIGTLNTETSIVKAGGYVVLAFAALGAYLFASASETALGGRGYNLGKAVRH